jgi:hypothetical protein
MRSAYRLSQRRCFRLHNTNLHVQAMCRFWCSMFGDGASSHKVRVPLGNLIGPRNNRDPWRAYARGRTIARLDEARRSDWLELDGSDEQRVEALEARVLLDFRGTRDRAAYADTRTAIHIYSSRTFSYGGM